jgi:hypothetical protein
MSRNNAFLFSEWNLRAVLEGQEAELMKEIEGIGSNQLLNTSIEVLCEYFERKYKLEPIRLKEDGITVDQAEKKIDVSQDFLRAIHDRSEPFYVSGIAVTYYIPFEGDADLFKCHPSTSTINPPRGLVKDTVILDTYERTDHNAAAIKTDFDHNISEMRRWLEWIERDVTLFNNAVREKAKNKIEKRREKLLKDQGLVAQLGFPLRRREDAPQTYEASTVRRKAPVVMPTPSTKPFVPEPTLDIQEYEHILNVISNMVAVMERSPHAFHGMKEPDIRQHFLVQLNGQYEGQATGETFNFEGKTDILIRVEGKNIFIAECKFWDGPESLRKTIDQLLGYATWRDTKTAILVFNRAKNFSAVLAKIPEVIKAHPNFMREIPYKSESGFRYVLHHRDDKSRELTLTILAFEVPSKEE